MAADTPVQATIGDLTAGYLRRMADAQAAGLESLETTAEVSGYDAGPVQPVDAQLAWHETLTVARCYGCDRETQAMVPPGWPGLVAGQEPVVALACALGNFPQMVRHLHTILQSRDLTQLRPGAARPGRSAEKAGELLAWADQMAQSGAFPQLLLVLGTLRLAKQFEHADRIVKSCRVPAAWRSAWDNERAALLWHRGQTDEASKLWHALEATPAVLFNRGMSDLFLGRASEAQIELSKAAAQLPAAGAWHHLGQLYLALA